MSRAFVCLCVLVSVAACGPAGEDGDPSVCAEAEAAVTDCLGADASAPFTTCDATEQQSAASILEQLSLHGCNGPSAGKSDGAFCGSWDPLGWCSDPAPVLGPTPKGKPTKYPILLAHGFNTSTTNFWAFWKVDTALTKDGHKVMLASVSPFDDSKARAVQLKSQVDKLLAKTGAKKVNLLCFSQGGVDCRWLVSPNGLKYASKVASVTLLSAPNRGTYIGDAGVALLPNAGSATGDLVDLFASWYGSTFSTLARDSKFIAALKSMSEAGMADFNRTAIDAPGLYYQSWAGFSYVAGVPNPRDTREADCTDDQGNLLLLWNDGRRDVMDPLLVPGAAIVAHGTSMIPNDGVTTIRSAKWGRFRGCLPADHLDQVGQVKDSGVDRRTGFDYLRWYRNTAFELATMGY